MRILALQSGTSADGIDVALVGFEPTPEERPPRVEWDVIVANPTTPTSVRLSKDLKKRG